MSAPFSLSLAVSSLYDPPSLLSLSPSLPSCSSCSSSPSFGSLLTDDFIKLSLPSARTHFHCFPYLDSILLIGGSSFLSPLTPSVSRSGVNLFDVWQFLPSKTQWLLLSEDPAQTLQPGSACALSGDCVIGFGGLRPRLSLFFLHRAVWKTLSLVGVPARAHSGGRRLAAPPRHRHRDLRLPQHALRLRRVLGSPRRELPRLSPQNLLLHRAARAHPARPPRPVSPFAPLNASQSHAEASFASLSAYCASVRSAASQTPLDSDLGALQHQIGFSPMDLPRHLHEVFDLSLFCIPNEKSKLPPMLDYWNFPSPRVAVSNGNSPRKERHVSSQSWIPNPPPPPKVSLRRTQSGNLAKTARTAGKERKLNPFICTSFPPTRGKSFSAAEKRSEPSS